VTGLRASPPAPRLRFSEWVFGGYFVYVAVAAHALGVRPPVPLVVTALNAAVLAGLLLLAWADGFRRARFLGIVRDWYPYPLMLLGYREMGWFAAPRDRFPLEEAWVVWDRVLLNDWGLKAAIEILGPVVPSILEISYSLVYAIVPFSMAVLYLSHRRHRVDAFLFIFLAGIFSAYALFPYFPSEPPRTVFPGEDFPTYITVFRKFNWWFLGGYGIHTSVFPSAHVSGAFSAAFAMRTLLPERRWAGRLLLALAVLIATATIYGRYHYAVDALAGFAVSLAAWGAGTLVERGRRGGRPPARGTPSPSPL
jgi:membrane-associated phospholipid phosphatase